MLRILFTSILCFPILQNSSTYGSVRLSRGVRRDELVDIAAGYDESDSFIDNTDAVSQLFLKV